MIYVVDLEYQCNYVIIYVLNIRTIFDTIDNSIVMKGEKEEMVGERKKEYHFTASDMPFIMVKECYCPPT